MESERTYGIAELARILGVTSRTIRFYEEIGLIEGVGRPEGAHRRYRARTVVHIKRIQQLKDYGLSLAKIRELFGLARQDRSGEQVRAGLAEAYKRKLDEALKRKASLEAYIDDLSWHIEQLEKVHDFFACPGASCPACRWKERCDLRDPLGEEA